MKIGETTVGSSLFCYGYSTTVNQLIKFAGRALLPAYRADKMRLIASYSQRTATKESFFCEFVKIGRNLFFLEKVRIVLAKSTDFFAFFK